MIQRLGVTGELQRGDVAGVLATVVIRHPIGIAPLPAGLALGKPLVEPAGIQEDEGGQLGGGQESRHPRLR